MGYEGRHKILGLCCDCPNPALPGEVRCAGHKEKARISQLRRKYNLTAEDVEHLDTLRDDGCMICGKQNPHNALSVDHNHAGGRVRGLLCYSCNGHLAWLENHRLQIEEYLEEEHGLV